MAELLEQETILEGGSLTHVVRVGNTVRRPTGPWTPAIHSVLRHLESVGFAAAPRVLGIDEKGGEVLSFIEGITPTRPWFDELLRPFGVAKLAALLRSYHDAVRHYRPADTLWQMRPRAIRPGEIICHGDFSPGNTLWQGDSPIAIVDWDVAGPGRPIEDVARLAWYSVPFRPDAYCIGLGFTAELDRRARLSAICTAYGEISPDQVIRAAEEVMQFELVSTERLGPSGVEPWCTFYRKGFHRKTVEAIEWLRRNAGEVA